MWLYKVTCARTAIRGQSILVLHFALRHVPGTGHDTDRVRADNINPDVISVVESQHYNVS